MDANPGTARGGGATVVWFSATGSETPVSPLLLVPNPPAAPRPSFCRSLYDFIPSLRSFFLIARLLQNSWMGVFLPRRTYHRYQNAISESRTNSGTPTPNPAASGVIVDAVVEDGVAGAVLVLVLESFAWVGDTMGVVWMWIGVVGMTLKVTTIGVATGAGIWTVVVWVLVVLVVLERVTVTVRVVKMLPRRLLVLVRVVVTIIGGSVVVTVDWAPRSTSLSRLQIGQQLLLACGAGIEAHPDGACTCLTGRPCDARGGGLPCIGGNPSDI